MDILTYINRMNQIYGNGPAPAPRYNTQQYLQGGRVGYQGGQLVDHGPGRQGYKGEKITFTPKEVKAINAKLPAGISLIKRKSSVGTFNFEWIGGKTAGSNKRYWKSRAVTNKDPLKDKGLDLIKTEVENYTKEYLPNRITLEKYKELRYLDKNIDLTANEFAKKLDKYTTKVEGKPITGKNASLYDSMIGLRKHKSYSFKEQKDLVKNTLDKNEYKDIINLDISDAEKESLIRRKANTIRGIDKALAETGSFAAEKTREARLFRNFYEAQSKGTRIEIGGTFDGKDLSKRKNWPTNKDGSINWSAKDKKGKLAWKSVVFTDTQTPKGKVKFSFDNLKSQVDDAFGAGHFASSTDAYAVQAEAYKNFGGADIAKQNIIKNYQKRYPGKTPTDGYIRARMRAFAPAQVHHWAEGGIGADPYKVQLTSRSANQNLGYAERTYKASLRTAGGDPIKIKEAENIFKNEIKKISKEMGGIQYNVAGQSVGDAPTVKSAYKAEKNIANILSTSGIRCGQAKGINCSDPRAYIKSINELKAKAALGDKVALGKFRKVANAMRKFKGPLAFTGWGLLGEIGFALPFAAMDYADGKSTAQIMNNASLGLFGMNEEEEAISYLPKDSLGGAIPSAMRAGERIEKLEDPNRIFPKGRMGMDENRFQKAQAKVIPDAKLALTDKVAPFLEGPRNEFFNDERAAKAYNELEIAKAKLKADELQRAKERAVTSVQFPEFNAGGRVSFKGGGIDKGRRAFMKLLAALGIGTATVGTGLIKLGGKAVGKKAAVTAGADIVAGTQGMPSWFPALVNKIIKEGDDVTSKLATKERELVHTKKIGPHEEVTVYRNTDTGDVRVEYGTELFVGKRINNKGKEIDVIRASNDPETVHLEYKAGEVIEEGKHAGKKTKSEFSAAESEPEVVNWDGDIEMSGVNEVNKVDDLITPTNKLQEFATNKKLNIRERLKLERQQKYKDKLDTDTMEQLDYIEKKHGPLPDEGDYTSADQMNEALSKYRGEKASGGLASYDDYLPGIDELD